MGFNITLPLMGSQRQGTKDTIISILSREWPLSAREIHNKLKRENSNGTTYQATHKTIQHLLEQGVLEKDGKKYLLCKGWIETSKEFYSDLHSQYSNNVKKEVPATINLTFDSIYEVDKFLVKTASEFPHKEDSKLYLYWCHAWIPLFFPRETYMQAKKIFESIETYLVIRGNTAIDVFCTNYWKNRNVNERCGVDLGSGFDFAVHGDDVIQVFYPKEVLKEIDSVYSKAKSPIEIDANALFENAFERKTEIPVVLMKNPRLAKHLKEQIMKNFKEAKNVK